MKWDGAMYGGKILCWLVGWLVDKINVFMALASRLNVPFRMS